MASKKVAVVFILVTAVSMAIAQAPEEGTIAPTTVSHSGGLAAGPPAYYNPAQEARDRLVTFLLLKSMMGGDGEGSGMIQTMFMLRAFGLFS